MKNNNLNIIIEATIILLDNSEYSRNGDLEPSR